MNATRKFLRRALAEGLTLGLITPADVLGHATANVLAHSLPADDKAKLLEASLASGKMTPDLIIDTLGPEVLATHVPQGVLWACICEVAERALGTGEAKRKPTVPAKSVSVSAPVKAKASATADEVAKKPAIAPAPRTNRNTIKRSPLSPAARFKAAGKPLETAAVAPFDDVQTNVRDEGHGEVDDDVWPIATDYDVIEEAEADAMIVQTKDAWPAGTPTAGTKS